MGATAVVLGASGFTGAELVRVLRLHPALDAIALGADRRAGEDLARVQPHLHGVDLPLLPVPDAAATDADVCFSCLPSGVVSDLLASVRAGVLVDLSDAYRGSPGWAYGLTEIFRDEIKGSARIANPGCYPTATLLGLLPFARAGVVSGPVVVDALSGTSGAGRSGDDDLSFTTMFGTMRSYGSIPHRHVAEMERFLEVASGLGTTISFTPHLVPIARGLLATVRAATTLGSDEDAYGILRSFFASEPFVEVTTEWPTTKAVAGSNRVLVGARVDRRAGLLVCSIAIDNLGKGAAGQAVQNANVALGLDETTGLEALGVWP